MSTSEITSERRAIRLTLIAGFGTLILLLGGLGFWSVLASIEGAVIAGGSMVQDGKNKQVQHDEGGVIKALHVREGDYIEAGTPLIDLDDTRIRVERDVLRKRLFEMKIKRERLIALRDDKKKFEIPGHYLLEAKAQKDLQLLIEIQENLFQSNLARRANKRQQLEERLRHHKKEIGSLRKQLAAEKRRLDIFAKEVGDLGVLRKKRVVSLARYNTLRREKAESESEIGRLDASIARAQGQVAETKLLLIENEENVRGDMLKEQELTESAIVELQEKTIAADYRLKRLHIVSPYAGRVHELKPRTVGGVIEAGETLMKIVPQSDRMTVEARIQPNNIDQVKIGLPAMVRFTVFNQRTTPQIKAKVFFVSPDHSRDDITGELYFTVRLAISPEKLRIRLDSRKIIPGMPAEVMIRTETRTVISFLTKPLTDQFNRAFREE